MDFADHQQGLSLPLHCQVQEVIQPRPRLDLLRPKTEHLTVALVAHDQPPVVVGHEQTLRHVVQRGVETRVLNTQSLVAPAQGRVLRAQALIRSGHRAVRRRESRTRTAQIIGQHGEPRICCQHEAVIPQQQDDQENADRDQSEVDGGGDEMKAP
jgi:hypothetical protein